MPTNKELENKVQLLEERIARIQASSSRMRDDLAELKSHYGSLVEGLNERFEVLRSSFPGQQ